MVRRLVTVVDVAPRRPLNRSHSPIKTATIQVRAWGLLCLLTETECPKALQNLIANYMSSAIQRYEHLFGDRLTLEGRNPLAGAEYRSGDGAIYLQPRAP
jgi:hypothetical protein